MLRPALLIAACLLAAACKPAAKEPSVHEQEAVRAKQIEALKGWDRLFGAPDATVAAANQFGFRVPGYFGTSQGGYEAKGTPAVISNSFAASPNRVSFSARGASAERIDSIGFELPITDKADAETARKRTAKLIRDFLFQFGIKDEGELDAVAAGTEADGLIGGKVPMSVTVSQPDADGDVIIVTFTRPADSAPAKQPQGQ